MFYNILMKTQNYYTKRNIQDIDKIEELLSQLPSFCEDYFLGVESRTSSPVRIERDETCQSLTVKGLYPCGEGAGYAGGITSSAADGIRVADCVYTSFL